MEKFTELLVLLTLILALISLTTVLFGFIIFISTSLLAAISAILLLLAEAYEHRKAIFKWFKENNTI